MKHFTRGAIVVLIGALMRTPALAGIAPPRVAGLRSRQKSASEVVTSARFT